MPQATLLNPQVITQIISDTSIDMLEPLLAAFLDELVKHQQLLTSAHTTGNIQQVTGEAHALKSCSGTFGAERLYQQAMQLEDNAKLANSNATLLSDNVATVIETIEATRKHYQAYDFSEIKNAVSV